MSLKSRIEAVLFISGKALSVDEIADVLGEPAEDIEMQLLELIMDYSSRDGALEVDDEDGYIIQVREEYMDIVEKNGTCRVFSGCLENFIRHCNQRADKAGSP